MKRIASFLLAAAMIFGLVGCSSTGSSSSSSQTSASPSTSGNVVKIRFANWDGGDALKAYQNVVQSFNKEHSNIQVSILNIPDEYSTKITTMAAANDMPEICLLDASNILYPLSEEGKIVNLEDLMNKDKSYDNSQMLDNMKVWNKNGKMIGYGIGPENICLFYNPSLFKKYGVGEPPASYANAWDWNTFVNVAKKLTIDKNGNNALSPKFDSKNISTYGVSMSEWWANWMPFIYSAGGSVLDKSGAKFALDSAEAGDAMQKLADLINVDHVCPTPTASKTIPSTSAALSTKKVAMVIDGQWSNNSLMTDGVDYDVAALPKIGATAKTVMTYGVLCVTNTPKQSAAWEFFKYLTKTGAAKTLEQSGLWLPSTKDGYDKSYLSSIVTSKHPKHYYEAICQPMVDGTAEAMPSTQVVNFGKINDILTPALDNVWAGKKTYKEAVASVSGSINPLVSGYYSSKQ